VVQLPSHMCTHTVDLLTDRTQFDAIGFSQGGLFLRYYAQYCNSPPVKNLITVC
jgi:triacylglycerol esterase/lipase EstA (alpha/beta hydrolase family)